MGGQDAVAGFRASLGDLRKLFSQTSEAADGAQTAQQAREASDAEAVREGCEALDARGEARGPETRCDARREAQGAVGSGPTRRRRPEEAAGPGQARGQGEHREIDSRECPIKEGCLRELKAGGSLPGK